MKEDTVGSASLIRALLIAVFLIPIVLTVITKLAEMYLGIELHPSILPAVASVSGVSFFFVYRNKNKS